MEGARDLASETRKSRCGIYSTVDEHPIDPGNYMSEDHLAIRQSVNTPVDDF